MREDKKKPPRLAIVIPCYNEQHALPETLKKLHAILSELIEKNRITIDSFIYCIDDGSTDKTWSTILEAHEKTPAISRLKLSRNEGHQKALLAGLMQVKEKVDCAISIDADLQDDITAIKTMVEH